jgi:hypothetical protein
VRCHACLAAVFVALIALFAGRATATRSTPSAARDGEQTLVDTFAPILFIANDRRPCTNSVRARFDPYDPIDVEIMLRDAFPSSETRLKLDDNVEPEPDSVLLGGAAPTAFELGSNGDPRAYLDITDLAPNQENACARYAARYATLQARYRRVTYASIRRVSSGMPVCRTADLLRVQYWFFYYFNNWHNNHEGDWERIELFFGSTSIQEIVARQLGPTDVRYVQHGSQATCVAWGEGRLRRAGNHPKVYVARGSHASYQAPRRRPYLVKALFDWVVSSERKARRVVPLPVLVPSTCLTPSETDPVAWRSFRGRWGEEVDGDDWKRFLPDNLSSGPVAPPFCATR